MGKQRALREHGRPGSAGPPVEVADTRSGGRHPEGGRGKLVVPVHCGVTHDRRPNGGAAGVALGARRPRWPPRCHTACALVHPGVAVGPGAIPRRGRRTLALPQRVVAALHTFPEASRAAGSYVFATRSGAALDAANVRRSFRAVIRAAGLDPSAWTPRELRHSFVSLLSADGMTLEEIAQLCGQAGTRVTESARPSPQPAVRSAGTSYAPCCSAGRPPWTGFLVLGR